MKKVAVVLCLGHEYLMVMLKKLGDLKDKNGDVKAVMYSGYRYNLLIVLITGG